MGAGSLPLLSMRSTVSGSRRIFPRSATQRSTIATGSFAGPMMPNQVSYTNPGMPASVIAGTSGKPLARFAEVTAIGRSRPSRSTGAIAATGNT